MRSVDDTLNALQDELRIVESSLAEPDVASDLTRLRDLSRRHKELSEINVAWNELKPSKRTTPPPKKCSMNHLAMTVNNGVKK